MSQPSLRNGANAAPSTPGTRPRLAVIGTGLGGLAAAWLLKQAYDVTVFERHARPGMGIFTVDYVSRGLNTRIDIPTRVFSDGYYPHLQALLRNVGVRMHATDHSAAYADAGGRVFFHYGKFRALGRAWAYPKGSGAFSAAGLAVARDSRRFFARARLDMAGQPGALAQVTLGQYLDELLARQVCGPAFVQQVLLPTLSVICTCDYAGVLAYPADLILDYLCSGVMKQGVLRAEHGVDDIVPRLLDGVPAVCGVGVVQIEKSQAGLDVVTADGMRREFDHVVMAAQAQQSAAMLAQFPQYRSLLEQVPFESSSMLVHTDTGLLPRSRVSLSPVTYHVPSGAARPEVTVDLTKAFPTYRGQDAVFQTWNPMRQPRPGCHLAEVPFTRPVVTLQSREAMRRLRELQRDDALGLWFCGAYAADRVPLLEAAAVSAVDVARHLGVAIPGLMPKEFHDLAETALNHESGGATCWGNLGCWTPGASYPQACTALADQLAMRLDLNSGTNLVDVGFGCGDQLLHWLQRYQVRRLRGLNLSHSQTELARARLRQAGHADLAAHIQQGDVADMRTWLASDPSFPAPDILLALDCAYHFRSRQRFMRDAAQVLAPGGRLGMTDIILARAGLGLHEQAALRLIASLSHLPWRNLQTEEAYRASWENAGFEVVSWDDITDRVFEPFGDWLSRYKASLDPVIAARMHWRKYDATAKFLRWAARRRVLRYVVSVGRCSER